MIFLLRITEEFMLKGPVEVIWSNSLLPAGLTLSLDQAVSSQALNISLQDGDPIPLSNQFYFTHSHVAIIFQPS